MANIPIEADIASIVLPALTISPCCAFKPAYMFVNPANIKPSSPTTINPLPISPTLILAMSFITKANKPIENDILSIIAPALSAFELE